MGDGQTERMNRTIINMLKSLGDKEKKDWAKLLPKLTFAYNVAVNKTTGYSPYYLMFGRSPRLPLDSVFEFEPNEGEKHNLQVSYQKYVEEWEQSMNQAFEIAKKHSSSSGKYNKEYYNKKARGVDINVGDRVPLRNHAKKGGTGKLRSYWEDTIYLVVAKEAEIPVYTIKQEIGSGKEKRVHRNNIMSCNLVLSKEKEVKKKKKIQTPKRHINNVKILAESESDDEEIFVVEQKAIFEDKGEEMVEEIKEIEKLMVMSK